MAQTNPFDQFDGNGGRQVIVTKPADPKLPYEGPQAAATLEEARARARKAAAESPYLSSMAADDAAIKHAQAVKAQAEAGGGESIDDATKTYYAQQILAGAPMPSLGMGKQAAAARQAVMTEVARLAGARGLNGADLATQIAHYKAGSGQIANLEKMAGTIGVNEQTAMANGQQFIDRSAELPGQTPFAPLNAVSDFIQRRFGGTTISAADAAYNTFTNEYAKVVAGSPSGAGTLSDSARHEAMSTINGSGSLAQKQAAFAQMKADMSNRMIAIHGGINQAYKALTAQPGYSVPESTQALPAPGGADNRSPTGMGIGSGPGGMTIDPDRQKAAGQIESMLASGAPDDQIRAFAKSAGASPDSVEANLSFRKAHPQYRGGYDASQIGMVPKTPVAMSLNGGTGAVGTYAMSAANALTGNTLDNLTPDPALARAAMAGAAAANPTSSLLGGITGTGLGAAATELGAGAAAARMGIGATPWIARGADTAYGALSGAGAADDGSRAAGAVGGGVLGAAGGEAGRRFIGPTVGRLFLAGRRALGGGGGAVAPQAVTGADAALLGGVKKAGINDIAAKLAEAKRLGVPMSLADTSPNMTSLAGAAVRRSPTAADIAQNALLPRARGQIDRLGQAVTRDLGPVGNVPQISADMTEQARTAAGPLYQAAYAKPVVSTPELDATLGTPFGRQALGRAQTIAANERRAPSELGFAQDADGNTVLNPMPNQAIANHLSARDELDAAQEAYRAAKNAPGSMDAARNRLEQAREEMRSASFALSQAPDPSVPANVPGYTTQTLDYVKRGMDDVLEQHRNPITGRLQLDEAGRAQNQVKNQFLGEVDRINPAYRDARNAYAGPVQARDAMARGQDAFSLNPDELGMQVANQTPEHLNQMQLGYRSALMDKANQGRFSSNPFDATLGTPAAEQRLNTLYPNNPGVPNLLRQRDLEGQLARTNNAVLGNSMTAERGIADQTFAGGALPAMAADAGMMALGHPPVATMSRLGAHGLRGALALGVGKRAVAKADALAPSLFNTNPDEALSLANGLISQDDLYRNYINNLPGRRLGGIFGAPLLASGSNQ